MPNNKHFPFFPGSGFSGSVFLATSKRQPKSRFAVKSIKLYSHLETSESGGEILKEKKPNGPWKPHFRGSKMVEGWDPWMSRFNV